MYFKIFSNPALNVFSSASVSLTQWSTDMTKIFCVLARCLAEIGKAILLFYTLPLLNKLIINMFCNGTVGRQFRCGPSNLITMFLKF